MKSLRRAALFALMAAIAVPAAGQQTSPTITLGPNSTLLNITAEGQSRRTPDIATFTAGVVTQARNATEAMTENSRRMDAVVAALRRAGIADRDIQTSTIRLQPRYADPERDAQIRARQAGQPYVPPADPGPPRIVGYEAHNNVQVRVRQLGQMGRIIDTLISAGANQVHGPSFSLDEPRTALDEARMEAVANGRQRAELYARAAGLRVGRIISISEGGGFYPVQQDIIVTGRGAGYAAAPPPPPTPVSPGELTLGVNVSMQFELVR